jgi:hypothetical protein
MTENFGKESQTPTPHARRNPPSVRWMALGALLIVAGVSLGDRLVVAHVVEKQAQLAAVYHAQDEKRARGGELTDAEKAETRRVLLGNPLVLGGVAGMLLLLPIATGVIVGRQTRSARDAAISVSAGMVIGFFIAGTGPIAVAAGAVIYAGVGALAGLLGRRMPGRRNQA